MKVSNHRDNVDISQASRARKNAKAGEVKQKAAGEAAASGTASGAGDVANVDISGEAKALAAANQVAKSDSTDQAKIDRIKAMINGGTYKPDYGKVADKLVNEQVLQELS